MTKDDVLSSVLAGASLQVRLLPRKLQRKVLDGAIVNWQDDYDLAQPDLVRQDLKKRVKENVQFGPVVWIIISVVIGELVSRLLDWIIPRHEERVQIIRELRDAG